MQLTTRGKIALTLRLAAVAIVICSALEQSKGEMRGMAGMSDMFAAYKSDYMPGVVLVAIGVALFALCRPLVHAIFAGVEERPAAQR